jgi:hypothetical protein
MSRNSPSESFRATGSMSGARRLVRRQRMPQEMSKPTPPAEMMPPRSGSNAATPPIGKP